MSKPHICRNSALYVSWKGLECSRKTQKKWAFSRRFRNATCEHSLEGSGMLLWAPHHAGFRYSLSECADHCMIGFCWVACFAELTDSSCHYCRKLIFCSNCSSSAKNLWKLTVQEAKAFSYHSHIIETALNTQNAPRAVHGSKQGCHAATLLQAIS